MKKTIFIVSFFALLFWNSPGAYSENVLKSTLDDQKSVEITVYNSNLGLVKDTRLIALPQGTGELRFMDVASSIMPVTVHIESMNLASDIDILEQNYEYDLMNADKLLDKYVGKKIKIVDWNPYQDKKEIVEALLLSNNNGQIYEINNEIFLGHPGYKVLPQIPENLIAKPTLTWLFDNKTAQPHELKISYLTNDINWKADYVVVLDKLDTMASLNGWVTLDNKSGATYKNAKLKLVAGEVHRVTPAYGGGMDHEGDVMLMAKEARSSFQEESFFEYHIYDLDRPTTIKDKQTKQISLLKADPINVSKEFIVEGFKNYYLSSYAGQQDIKSPVYVYIKFKNEEKNHLGMPLPAGIMRLYKEDSQKALQFIGEDQIKHMPKDEEIKLKIGEAFDIVVERLQMSYQRPSPRSYESEWEIKIRNHKKEDVTVTILEPMDGDWRMMSTTHAFQKVAAFTARFDVKVPQDKEEIVKYKVVVRYP